METFVHPAGSTVFVNVSGRLPSPPEWEEIFAGGYGLNVLSLPDQSVSLEPLRPYAGAIRFLLINSGTCRDLRLVEDMPNLEWLGIGGIVGPRVNIAGLGKLQRFAGPVNKFPGVLDHPSIRVLGFDWPEPSPPDIGAPVEELTITKAKRLTGLPVLKHPQLLRSLVVHGCNGLSLEGVALLSGLERLHLDHCRHLRAIGGLTALASLVALVLEECPSLDDYEQLAELRAHVRVIGRNPFPTGFRESVADATWIFPPGAQYIPSAG